MNSKKFADLRQCYNYDFTCVISKSPEFADLIIMTSIPPIQQYIVTHIDEQQAVVIVQHSSGQYNMYLSELTGVYFALSLPDIVFENSYGVDLEVVSD